MKFLSFCIVMYFMPYSFSFAQFETNFTGDLKSLNNNDGLNFSVTKQSLLNPPKDAINYLEIPPLEDDDWDIQKEKRYHKGAKITKKLNTEGTNMPFSAFRKNVNFGSVIVHTNRVNIICRDHQAVDGDIIAVLVNDKFIGNFILDSSYKSFTLPLDKGFNKVDFKAINVGASYPNTAELIVSADDGSLLIHNQWMLDVGFRASVIIVRE